jgi:hypothetical protein
MRQRGVLVFGAAERGSMPDGLRPIENKAKAQKNRCSPHSLNFSENALSLRKKLNFGKQESSPSPLRSTIFNLLSSILRTRRPCSLRARSAKTLKIPNEKPFFDEILFFVARCVTYTYKLRNEARNRAVASDEGGAILSKKTCALCVLLAEFGSLRLNLKFRIFAYLASFAVNLFPLRP